GEQLLLRIAARRAQFALLLRQLRDLRVRGANGRLRLAALGAVVRLTLAAVTERELEVLLLAPERLELVGAAALLLDRRLARGDAFVPLRRERTPVRLQRRERLGGSVDALR